MSTKESVELEQLSLKQVLVDKTLKIPAYQRIYCWKEKTVIQLLNDLININDNYCIGSIIIQNKGDNVYDIIDGQQRLVTLSLLLNELGLGNEISLLNEKFEDSDAQRYIKYNRFLIRQFITKRMFKNKNKLLYNIFLNVLILNDDSIDLAYTFFSNENSRGTPLSDYDLLKAHHLRYVVTEPQQLHLATRWDKMICSDVPSKSDLKEHEQALALYVFRLRKWFKFDWWNEGERYNVKKEYESSPIVESIPPFGEQFKYFEPIQGGTHFFEFTNQAIEKMRLFKETKQYEMLHNLTGESHTLLRDVMEALIFAYYYKFGESYLTEATLLIARYVSQNRYENKKIHLSGIFEHVRQSKIPLLIETSTSPTFFLAEMNNINSSLMNLEQIKAQEKKNTVSDIRERYVVKITSCFKEINENEMTIKNLNTWV